MKLQLESLKSTQARLRLGLSLNSFEKDYMINFIMYKQFHFKNIVKFSSSSTYSFIIKSE